MNFQTIIPDKSISLFVKSIWVFKNDTNNIKTSLPFFADGFPGLIFQQSESGLIVHPHSKIMPEIFLYGQTICPVELEIFGKYSYPSGGYRIVELGSFTDRKSMDWN